MLQMDSNIDRNMLMLQDITHITVVLKYFNVQLTHVYAFMCL